MSNPEIKIKRVGGGFRATCDEWEGVLADKETVQEAYDEAIRQLGQYRVLQKAPVNLKLIIRNVLINRRYIAGLGLLDQMEARAQKCMEYKRLFDAWADLPDTLALRDLAIPFGDYWKDLAFQNAVDEIDTASLQ